METELTKKMKNGVIWHNPALNTKMRTIRYSTEVWTPTGIVDAIRFEDYKERDYSFCELIEYERFDKKHQDFLNASSNGKCGRCKINTQTYPNKNCTGCFYHKHCYDIGMLITCYECKITLSDFKSKNGHNFHGNKNFYVVPKELVEKIKPLVPDGIGIISYNEKTERFRTEKQSDFNIVPDDVRIKLLYNALGKWCK